MTGGSAANPILLIFIKQPLQSFHCLVQAAELKIIGIAAIHQVGNSIESDERCSIADRNCFNRLHRQASSNRRFYA